MPSFIAEGMAMHNPMRRKKNPEPDYGSHLMRLKPFYQKELGIADFNLHSDEKFNREGYDG
jgi:hypothetical protein